MGDYDDASNPTGPLIFFCVDAFEHSSRAFNWYYKHFYRDDHIVGLVQIYNPVEPPPFSGGKHQGETDEVTDDGEYQKKKQEVLKKSIAISRKFQEFCSQRNVKTRIFTEEKKETVGQTICNLAKEHNAACIVMGQRGLGAIKRAIYGSVSEYVLHHAHVAVLIVPPAKGQKDSK